MAARDIHQSPTKTSTQRLIKLVGGWLIGFAWGSLLWLITGMKDGAHGWAFAAITCAIIGFGVAAFFGATQAKQHGERIGPRLRVRLPFRR
jgi:uncharacterized membrane protein YczE